MDIVLSEKIWRSGKGQKGITDRGKGDLSERERNNRRRRRSEWNWNNNLYVRSKDAVCRKILVVDKVG